MNYTDIKDLILSYSDREDNDVVDRVDNFIKIAEARINRDVKAQKSTIRTTLTTQPDQEYYGLPSDFNGLRDIEISSESAPNDRETLTFLTPEQMNKYVSENNTNSNAKIHYTIIADQLQIYPPQDTKILEIVYYQYLPTITSSITATNWISNTYPDLYITAALVEINAFVKDGEAAAIWDGRYKSTVTEINNNDIDTRWSGSPLQIRIT